MGVDPRVKVALLAHRAAFDVIYLDFEIDATDVVDESLADMAYVGVMMADESLTEPGSEPVPDEPQPHTEHCIDDRLRVAWKERDEAVSNLNLRLSYARVVTALASLVCEQAWNVMRGGGTLKATDLEALGTALDAFDRIDEKLPRVSS